MLFVTTRATRTLVNEEQHEFQIEEYKSLREEIARHNNSRRVMETSIILGLAALYAWLYEKNCSFSSQFLAIYYMPIIIVILGVIREYGFRVRVNQIADYIREIEIYYYNGSSPFGWETNLWILRNKSRSNMALGISVVLFWILLFVISLGLSVVLYRSCAAGFVFGP